MEPPKLLRNFKKKIQDFGKEINNQKKNWLKKELRTEDLLVAFNYLKMK